MNKSVFKKYRLDYLFYLGAIIVLDVFALYYHQAFLLHISIGIVWLHMCWLAIKELQKKRMGTEFFLVLTNIVAMIDKYSLAFLALSRLLLIS